MLARVLDAISWWEGIETTWHYGNTALIISMTSESINGSKLIVVKYLQDPSTKYSALVLKYPIS